MPRRNGSKASAKVACTPPRRLEEIKNLFDSLYNGTKYKYVDRLCCIPFANMRKTTQYGVTKLISLYESTSTNNGSAHSVGLALGTDTSMVVSLIGSLEHV